MRSEAWTQAELDLLIPRARAVFHGASYKSQLRGLVFEGRTPGAVRAQLLKLVGVMKARAGEKSALAGSATEQATQAMARGAVR